MKELPIKLKFEKTPYKIKGRPRVWFLEEELKLSHFLWEELKRGILWLRDTLRNTSFGNDHLLSQLVVVSLLIVGFLPKAEALTVPQPITPPPYIKTIPKLSLLKPLKAHIPAIKHTKYIPPPKPVIQAPVVSAGVTGCGSDPYMAQIYMKESGCRTNAINPIGACGLGQALPCSKMGCSLSDWACQDAWFKNYAIATYGSYANALAIWQSKNWW